jgi:hypothetical protein
MTCALSIYMSELARATPHCKLQIVSDNFAGRSMTVFDAKKQVTRGVCRWSSIIPGCLTRSPINERSFMPPIPLRQDSFSSSMIDDHDSTSSCMTAPRQPKKRQSLMDVRQDSPRRPMRRQSLETVNREDITLKPAGVDRKLSSDSMEPMQFQYDRSSPDSTNKVAARSA